MDEASLRADMIEGLEHELGEPLEAAVLTALQRVPRETFVDDSPYANAASDEAGTRVLAPATAVRLIGALDAAEGDDVLVIGAGVGYSVAMLAEIAGARHVHAVDIDREAVSLARSNLSAAGYEAVLVDRRDGANGLPEYAPYDRILLEAAVLEPPRALRDQLDDDGRLVYPRGNAVQTVAAIETAPNESAEPDDDAPPGFRTVETAGPARLRPMLVDGEQRGVERNRTRREDAERAEQGHFAPHGWEQEWIDWDDRL
ncbi:protein-L-isoaspartate O-methyltransferase [Halorubrum sp. Ib24]|uniref:protein-L-isoaspartate O-methyltransferase family protein n=1 Tax=unclassified Halorubrum TaxID=2642239 RepID=UPI000B97FFF6|nr:MULTISPECIES: methyltransferase [unclassified Halorubrum]OYR39302.1 protein-L-isoaspartate O-methyltransferase [Halorubrum sp. Eb13]OYR42800.1 protein-L-isoaspartate O-methyltransferase [Halorubrum sp. Ib24]OYR46091.1 protein-L-isoaspartate O-methyltransferase [Halorubrum sp. Ea8]OYR52497.1 protein-L-isoaspartate O-methyltransferase [Halorubrum sp. Ea1]